MFVYKATGIPVNRLYSLSIYEYRVYFINAFVERLKSTDSGREKLREYYRYSKHETGFDADGILSIL